MVKYRAPLQTAIYCSVFFPSLIGSGKQTRSQSNISNIFPNFSFKIPQINKKSQKERLGKTYGKDAR